MGIGFWVTQVILLVAAIATGISAERRNRAERDRPPTNLPIYHIPLAPTGVPVGGSQFTADEQSRLVVLRRLVQQARALKTNLLDDLQPDATAVDDRSGRTPNRQAGAWRTPALWLGLFLILIGGAGVWQANSVMVRLEQEATGSVTTRSLASHLLPGVIANPGKYLAAVNSSSSAVSGGRDPIQVLAWLDQKEAVDRFEAVIGVGTACVLAATAGWPGATRRGNLGSAEDESPSSLGSDVLPFVLCASVFLAAMSFFELP